MVIVRCIHIMVPEWSLFLSPVHGGCLVPHFYREMSQGTNFRDHRWKNRRINHERRGVACISLSFWLDSRLEISNWRDIVETPCANQPSTKTLLENNCNILVLGESGSDIPRGPFQNGVQIRNWLRRGLRLLTSSPYWWWNLMLIIRFDKKVSTQTQEHSHNKHWAHHRHIPKTFQSHQITSFSLVTWHPKIQQKSRAM